MMDADWRELERIAQSLQASGLNATAGQVAGQLLHDSIARLGTAPQSYPISQPPPISRVSETSAEAGPRVQSVESPRVTYVVGAGINRGVVGPEDRQLPCAKDFFQYVLGRQTLSNDTRLQPLWDFIEAYWHLSKEALKTVEFDLEECFTLVELQRREAEASHDWERAKAASQIEFLLGGLLTECFSRVDMWHFFSGEYQAFGRRIWEQKAAVLTFNYDTLLEATIAHASPALADAKGALWVRFPERGVVIHDDAYSPRSWERLLAYSARFDEILAPGSAPSKRADEYYARSETAVEPPPFLKLHGSVDWHYRSGYTLDGRKIEGACGGSIYGWGPNGLGLPVLDHSNSNLEVLLPLIITPVLNKTIQAYPLLPGIWRRALEVLKETRRLVVAGYSFPATDFNVRRLFREAFANQTIEHLCVINPDAGVASLVRELCNFRRPVLVCRNIGEYLSRSIP
jgi:hypothetical protein